MMHEAGVAQEAGQSILVVGPSIILLFDIDLHQSLHVCGICWLLQHPFMVLGHHRDATANHGAWDLERGAEPGGPLKPRRLRLSCKRHLAQLHERTKKRNIAKKTDFKKGKSLKPTRRKLNLNSEQKLEPRCSNILLERSG